MLAAIAAALVVAAGFHAYRVARVGSGFSAELLCGGVFVSGGEDVKAKDLTGPGYELLRFFQETIDNDGKRVTASAYGFAPQTAVYRQGLGCTLIDGASEAELRKQAQGLAVKPSADAEALWPEGERVDWRGSEGRGARCGRRFHFAGPIRPSPQHAGTCRRASGARRRALCAGLTRRCRSSAGP
jgi:hypothetical protein